VALAVAAGAAGVALNVFGRRAPWRHYPWYLVGLLPGIGGTELGGTMAITQAAAGGLAIGLGAGRSKVGTAGLVVAAGSAAGLVGMHRRSVAAADVLDAALADALGPAAATAGPDPRSVRRADLLIDRDVRYHEDAPEQVLDVVRRRGLPTDTPAPVLVYVHGGSWSAGSKRNQGIHLIGQMAARGWLCVSIDYRLGPANRWPALIVDVKRALAWVRENIAAYGGDPSFIAVSGGSAGGHLATLAALSANDPAFQPGFEDADTTVQAAASVYGVYDLTALNDDGKPRLRDYVRKVLFDAELVDDPATWHGASPTWRLDEHAPPMFVVHGDRDEIVSVNQARAFAEQARAVTRGRFGYAELPYAHHAFDMVASARTKATVGAVGRFLDAARDDAVRTTLRDTANNRPTA
jgi:acetyl esterase/lipase